jgi:hypothetical protein
MSVTPALSVAEFFHDAVTSALRSQSVSTSELTEFYLVNLLSEFTHAEIDSQPLGPKLTQALIEPPGERSRGLREVGDTALYVSGFFGESLERGLVALDYYISMGGSAYAALAGLVRMSRAGEMWGGVYGELADKFPRFVDVLAEVSEKSAVGNNRGLLRLYERWAKTQNEWLERKLRASGLIVPPKSERQ